MNVVFVVVTVLLVMIAVILDILAELYQSVLMQTQVVVVLMVWVQ
jgi:hypothetical protein